MFKKLLRRPLWLLIVGVFLVSLVPALILLQHRGPAQASGGGCCSSGTSVSVFPNPASPGQTIDVTGINYPVNATVRVYFQTTANGVVTTVTDSGGFFSVPLTVPQRYVKGTRYFVHANSGSFSASVLFNFTKVSLVPTNQYGYGGGSFTFGSTIGFFGSGFAAGEAVDLVWDYGTLGTVSAGTQVTQNDGSFFANLIIPSIPSRTHIKLVATGRLSGLTASTPASELAAILVTPFQGGVGTQVAVKGGGFGKAETVTVILQGISVATATTDAKGGFTATFVVSKSIPIGNGYNALQAVGSSSGVGAATFFMVQPHVSISPNIAPSGSLITVSGSHFSPSNTVFVSFVDPSGNSGNQNFLGFFSTSAHGTFQVTVQIPFGLTPGKHYFIQVVDQQTGASNQARFTAQ